MFMAYCVKVFLWFEVAVRDYLIGSGLRVT